MFNLKNYIINQIINLKIVKDEEGKLVLKNSKLLEILNQNKDYEFLIIKALMLNKNVENVIFYYDDKTIEINYNKDNTKGEIIKNWANVVLSTILDDFDVIKNALENKLNVWSQDGYEEGYCSTISYDNVTDNINYDDIENTIINEEKLNKNLEKFEKIDNPIFLFF